MLDIKKIRSEFDKVNTLLARRNKNYELDKLMLLDKDRRALIVQLEDLKNKQNETSKLIPQMKANNQNTDELLEQMKNISETAKKIDLEVKKLDEQIEKMLLSIPNTPHESVPIGNSDADNVQIRTFGNPTKFNFEPKAHWELGEKLNILDANTASKRLYRNISTVYGKSK